MKRSVATAEATAILALACVAPSPAQASGTVTVTSPRCGMVQVVNSTASPVDFMSDSGMSSGVKPIPPGGGLEFSRVPAGEHFWTSAIMPAGDQIVRKSALSVKPCSASYPRRQADGDQNGDKLADVLGIQAGTGHLYYYEMTATGLVSRGKVGQGWQRFVAIFQVKEIDGVGTGDYLLGIRDDGSIWQYQMFGRGRFGSGKRVGGGMLGHKNFAVLPPNSPVTGTYLLLATQGDTLKAFPITAGLVDTTAPLATAPGFGQTIRIVGTRNFDTDRSADILSVRTDGSLWAHGLSYARTSAMLTPARKVGQGWAQMGLVTSTGSLNGDYSGDLIARRSDGQLFKYINRGGTWASAEKIGWGWGSIRLIG